ncbi:MAG: hypothetical protein R3B13_18015 [Polyangiaceae bacterium]
MPVRDLTEFNAALASFRREQWDGAKLDAAAAAWAERGQNEHASIAAFDRFSLGLLAAAAPPELLEAAHAAALDEIRHARLAFALASTYSARDIGPGPIRIDGALSEVSTLADLVTSTVVEGCIGETLSAIEIKAAIAATKEPAARVALEIIAEDEARHAELAWAFVRWATTMEPSLGPLARTTFEDSLPRAMVLQAACDEPELTAFGFASSRERMATRAAAVEEVLRPAAAVLA